MPCPDVFVQDVPKALLRNGLVFPCYMDPSQTAIIDAAYAVSVNYETYLFATSTARETFRGDVVLYCGLLTDPVTKQRFRPDDCSPRIKHEGVLYFFEGQDQYAMFVRAGAHLHVTGGSHVPRGDPDPEAVLPPGRKNEPLPYDRAWPTCGDSERALAGVGTVRFEPDRRISEVLPAR